MGKSLKQLKQEYVYLLEDVAENLRAQLELIEERPTIAAQDNVLYVLRQVGTHNYKIGISTNYQQRKAHFDVRLPFDVEEILIHQSPLFRELETALHKYFAANRLNNSEFFELTDDHIGDLPNIITMLEAQIRATPPLPIEEPEEIVTDNEDRDAPLVSRARELMSEYELSVNDVSVSFLQRKLSIGYARAARLKDRLLEESEE